MVFTESLCKPAASRSSVAVEPPPNPTTISSSAFAGEEEVSLAGASGLGVSGDGEVGSVAGFVPGGGVGLAAGLACGGGVGLAAGLACGGGAGAAPEGLEAGCGSGEGLVTTAALIAAASSLEGNSISWAQAV